MLISARRGYGYNIVTSPLCEPVETDTEQCAHCNRTLFIHDGGVELPVCLNCDKRRCPAEECAACVPFMRKVEAAEAAARNRLLMFREADNV